jgi:mannosyltransferase
MIAAITTIGGLLRAFHLGAQSLWLDELFSVFVARRDWAQVILGTAQGDTNPPLFNLLLHFFLQLGSDETAARLGSLIFAILAIPLFYVVARALFDVHVATLATLLLALNPFQLFYAQEARMYALLAFFTLAAMLFFLRAWRYGDARDWLAFTLVMTLAFYTHSLAFLNLIALDIFAVTQQDLLKKRWRPLAFSHIAILLLFVPWLGVLGQQVARVQSGFWGTLPSPLVLFSTPYLFLFGAALPLTLVPVALFVELALLAFALLAIVKNLLARAPSSLGIVFALCIFGAPIITLYLISFIRPIFVERTLIASSFGLYLLLAWAATTAPPRKLNLVLGLIVLVITFVALQNYFFNPDTQKPQMREAARALATQFQPGDVVAHTSDSSALAFMYYAPSLPNYFLAGDPDYTIETTRGRSGEIAGLVPETATTIVANHRRVWLVVALDHNEDYQRARVAELKARWTLLSESQVGNIAELLFELSHSD